MLKLFLYTAIGLAAIQFEPFRVDIKMPMARYYMRNEKKWLRNNHHLTIKLSPNTRRESFKALLRNQINQIYIYITKMD